MFVIRSVSINDIDALYKLSHLVHFLNLPRDLKIIKSKVERSIISFSNPSEDLSRNYYFFVLENTETGEIIGTSMIHAQHGTQEEPNFYLKVGQEHKYSTTINTGFVHGTLKLGMDVHGPTEIGGLVLHPDYRGHKQKLGKRLSFVRFLYMAMFPERFKEDLHSELMPPLDEKGNSPLWEAIGRKFMNMDYHSADVLSHKNKEFILNLYPSHTIYVTLLPIAARNAIGEVGKETKPVKKMLEEIGFHYADEVDPFDGGPHYRAKLKDLKTTRNFKKSTAKIVDKIEDDSSKSILFSLPSTKYSFAALFGSVSVKGDKIEIPRKLVQDFEIPNEFEVHFIEEFS